MYKVENLLNVVLKHYIFASKYVYKSTNKINTDALFRLITERIFVETIYCLEMVIMPSMKNTRGKCDLLDDY